MTEYIIRSTHGKSVKRYHTDPNCAAVQQMNGTRTVGDRYITNQDVSECKRCAGKVERPDTNRKSLRTLLEQGEL